MNQKKANEARVSKLVTREASGSILLDAESLKSVGIIDCDGLQTARSEIKQHACADVIIARELSEEVIVA